MKASLPTLAAALLGLCSCTTTSGTTTETTVTAPDGTVTRTVKQAPVDPFDVAIAEAARQLFALQGGEP